MNPIVSKDEFSKKLEREIRESDDSDPFDYPLYGDLFFSENQILIDDVAAAQAACVLDPNNAQNFKACGLALKRLAYRMPYHSKREQLTQDAKSMLDKALTMDDTDYETMYQLGIVHFSILEFDSTLESYGEVYMKLYHDAIRYFKQVQDKAPQIYQEESWLKDINRFLPQVMSELELKEYLSRLESSPSSEPYIEWDMEEKRLIQEYKLMRARIAEEMSLENLW